MDNDDLAQEKRIKTAVRITGMTCAACSNAVERALRKVQGVDFAAVNLSTETAFIIHSQETNRSDLEKAVEKVGYGVTDEMPEAIERRRYLDSRRNLVEALAVTIPLAVLMIMHMAGLHMTWFPMIELVAGGFVVFRSGRNNLRGAWIALTHLHTNMDTLISTGSIAAWLTTLLHVTGVPVVSFGSIGAMIVALHILGRFIESSLRDRAAKEIKNLLKLRALSLIHISEPTRPY